MGYLLALVAVFSVSLVGSLLYAARLHRDRRAIYAHADANPPANDLWS